MGEFLGLLAMSFLAGVAIYRLFKGAYAKRQAWEKAWRELAERNGLTLELQRTLARESAQAKQPTITLGVAVTKPEYVRGVYRGRPIELTVRGTIASDKSIGTYYRRVPWQYTWITTTLNQTKEELFALRERNLVSVLDRPNYRWRRKPEDETQGSGEDVAADLPKPEEAQTGDPNFDRRFYVESRPSTFAGRVLTFGLREKLIQAGRPIEVKLEGRDLIFIQKEILTDAAYLQFLLDLTADLAEAFEQAW